MHVSSSILLPSVSCMFFGGLLVHAVRYGYLFVARHLSPLFSETSFLTGPLSTSISELDNLIRVATAIGCMLHFRRMLYDAARDVLARTIPSIVGVVESSLTEALRFVLPPDTPGLQQLTTTAADCGMVYGSRDMWLEHAVARHQQGPQVRERDEEECVFVCIPLCVFPPPPPPPAAAPTPAPSSPSPPPSLRRFVFIFGRGTLARWIILSQQQ